jgi:sirohydrochlorin cobaltochelatase
VSARREHLALYLPASPAYRIEKEIKNVITVVAKTCHYWFDHIPKLQKWDIGQLFARIEAESLLIQPALFDPRDFDECKRLSDKVVEAIRSATGLKASNQEYVDWVGTECSDIHKAIWLMRTTVVNNVVSRREGTTVFMPVNPVTDPEGETVLRTVRQVYSFATVGGVL